MRRTTGNEALREVYDAAVSFPQYLCEARANAQRFRLIYEQLANVAHDVTSSIFLPGTRLLVFSEMYCADCVINLPLVARLVEASAQTDLRVVSRDSHRTVADGFPGRGGVSRIPTVVLLDSECRSRGYWSERAKSDHEWMSNFTRTNPLPHITLEHGIPIGDFAQWLERRFEAQLPIFYKQNWKDVREELRELVGGAGGSL